MNNSNDQWNTHTQEDHCLCVHASGVSMVHNSPLTTIGGGETAAPNSRAKESQHLDGTMSTRVCTIFVTERGTDFQIRKSIVQRTEQQLFILVHYHHTRMADKSTLTSYTITYYIWILLVAKIL